MTMKGLVLSGGAGTRLRPLTHTQAKQLIPVANKPVLFYGLEQLANAGIRDVGIVVGDTALEIEAAVGDGSRWGMRATYIPQEAPLGLAHAVKIARDFVGDDPFVVYLGDNILRDGVREVAEGFAENDARAQILLARVPHPERFGVAELDPNEPDRIVRLVEKPSEPRSDLALVGVYLFDRSIFEAIETIRPSGRGELEITDAIQALIDRGDRVDSRLVRGWWKDTGKPEDLLEANRVVLDGFERRIDGSIDHDSSVEGVVVLESGASIESCVVRGPVVIGAGARLSHARVGPYASIAADVVVENAHIEHSILLRGAQVRGLQGRVVDSLIGRHTRVSGNRDQAGAHRHGAQVASDGESVRAQPRHHLVVGDSCTIGIGE